MHGLDPRIVYAIAAASGGTDVRTVAKWLTGHDVRGAALRMRLIDAARSVGVERSPAPPTTGREAA